MTKNSFVLIGLSFVLLVSMAGCGTFQPVPTPTLTPTITATASPTNTLEPTSTPTPTATPFGDNIVSLLSSMGFKASEDKCDPQPCSSWENNELPVPGLFVLISKNQVQFAYDFDYPGDDVLAEAAELDELIINLYGQNVDNWIADQLKKPLPGTALETIDGFDVKATIETNQSTCFNWDATCKPFTWHIYRITISPTGLPTETPTPVPPTPTTNPLSSVLLANGFVRNTDIEGGCNCEGYQHANDTITGDRAYLFPDGTFSMNSEVGKTSDIQKVEMLMAKLATGLYSPEIGDWITKQEDFPAQTTIGGHKVFLQEQHDDPLNWYITLIIK
jgi:hypothetical protein